MTEKILKILKDTEHNNSPRNFAEQIEKLFAPGTEFEQDNQKLIVIPASEIETLVNTIEEVNKERDLIKWGMFELLSLLGITNEEKTKIRPEIISGDEGIFKGLMKKGGELFFLFSQTSLPGSLGRKAEAQVKEKFAFVEKVLPVLNKYGEDGK